MFHGASGVKKMSHSGDSQKLHSTFAPQSKCAPLPLPCFLEAVVFVGFPLAPRQNNPGRYVLTSIDAVPTVTFLSARVCLYATSKRQLSMAVAPRGVSRGAGSEAPKPAAAHLILQDVFTPSRGSACTGKSRKKSRQTPEPARRSSLCLHECGGPRAS